MKDIDSKAVVKTMQDVPVLVVGDMMLDRFVYGNVERISPESPVPVLSVTRETSMLGGAGNTLANLSGLGAKGYALCVIGDDEEGRILTDKAQALALDISGFLTEKTRPTIVKTRYLAGHQQLLRTDYERAGKISDTSAKALVEKAKELISKVKMVVLSDYGKGVLRNDVIAQIIEQAREQDVRVIVDPKGQDFSLYKGAFAVTPNKKELAAATAGMAVGTDEEIIAAAQHIIKTCGIETVVATRSAEGMSIIQQGQEPYHVHGQDIEVYDVSGAGDTVIATIAAAMASGADIKTAAKIANTAGMIAVTKVGTAPIRSDELIAALDEEMLQPKQSAGVYDLAGAQEIVSRWRAKGLKIGLTNGCFDILHFGHVSYLEDARRRCDRLIVGLNNDDSVRLLKGADRPVHDEVSRSAVLGALSAVDLVILFGARDKSADNTATRLVEALQPDLYFKGGDYRLEQIPEAPAVIAQGGEVCIISEQKGHSTTKSLKKRNTAAA